MISGLSNILYAVSVENNAVLNMMNASNRMLNAPSFGNSQPLKPHFAAALLNDELSMKADETKISVLKKFIAALEKRNKNSAPKYAGLNIKA